MAEHEWLRTARGHGFAPWPSTADERQWLRALHRAQVAAVAAWRARQTGIASPS